MLKPSFKSLEGQSLGGVLLGGLACLYTIFTGDDAVPLDQILAHAESAKEVAAIYAQEATNTGASGIVGMGKAGVVLVFMYKMYAKFTDARTDLKASELEANAQLEVARKMIAKDIPVESARAISITEKNEPSVSPEKREGDA